MFQDHAERFFGLKVILYPGLGSSPLTRSPSGFDLPPLPPLSVLPLSPLNPPLQHRLIHRSLLR